MELLDIYDEKGNSLGYSRSREEAHKKGLWHKVACVFIVNDKKKIIMQKRSALKVTNPNGWTCSASGHIDAGEDVITGALRELEEEIGVKATIDELKYIGTAFENYISNTLHITHISDIFVIYKNVDLNLLNFQEEEVSDAKYFDISEIENTNFSKKHNQIFNILKKEILENRE